ncbi:MAG TPA: hypothetical protein VGM62_20410 [Chthoniobacterales bacterium]|jgi:hypothetical protein
MKYKPAYLASLVLSFFALFAAVCPSAKGNYIAYLNEVGSNVVGTGSGSIDFTDLAGNGILFDSGRLIPSFAGLVLGTTVVGSFDSYTGVSGPTSFGSVFSIYASSGTGNLVAIVGAIANVDVPQGYVSGTPLGVSTDTWNSSTFASLGIIPGTYTWTWGTGMHADSYTLNIGQSTPTNGVPETGSTIALMLGAVGMLAAFRQKLRVERTRRFACFG